MPQELQNTQADGNKNDVAIERGRRQIRIFLKFFFARDFSHNLFYKILNTQQTLNEIQKNIAPEISCFEIVS